MAHGTTPIPGQRDALLIEPQRPNVLPSYVSNKSGLLYWYVKSLIRENHVRLDFAQNIVMHVIGVPPRVEHGKELTSSKAPNLNNVDLMV